jgi:hypothetical protein
MRHATAGAAGSVVDASITAMCDGSQAVCGTAGVSGSVVVRPASGGPGDAASAMAMLSIGSSMCMLIGARGRYL